MTKNFISETTIAQVRELPLEQVVQRYTPLKKAGTRHWACCPFHNEKTPSFSVTPSKGIYKCFGCGQGGNSPISFIMAKEGLEFPEAVELLAKEHGIPIEYDNSQQAEERAKQHAHRLQLTEVNALARDHYMQNLKDAEFPPMRWSSSVMEHWDVGLALDEFNDLRDALREPQGAVALVDAKELGLLREKNGKVYDGFRNRLMFPICDHRGQVVGFTGRNLEEGSKYPKYINSPENDVYHKGEVLYGLHHAKESIAALNCAILVEGTADVISLHCVGRTNTVAPCGTAVTEDQLRLLAKYCTRLIVMTDGDAAGLKAMHRTAEMALQLGFVVDVVLLPEGEDPDSLFNDQLMYPEWVDYSEVDVLEGSTIDYIVYAAQQITDTDQRIRAKELDAICKLLAYNGNDLERQGMIDEVVRVTGEKSRKLTKAVNDHRRKWERKNPENVFHANAHLASQYTMPEGVSCSFNDVREDVVKYCFFTDHNRIYMRRGDEGGYTFRCVSNFSIRVIQHMEDEKFPRRLVQIINIHGRKRTFDTSTDDFVTELSFKKMIEGKGNYTWSGKDADFERLTTKLKDDMGDGRMITILGQQPEGFWCMNNAVAVNGQVSYLDEHGCFDYEGDSYYVPSGNSIYERNDSKFFPQKRALLVKSKFTFNEVAMQMVRVHRNHAFNSILFTVATCFSDLIYDRTSFFPILFLYGEAGSGKDNLIEACQSFFGKPQTPITITGRANTDKAKIRKFAQFTNFMGHMTEYSPGSDDTDQMMKSFWDRVGYERGTIDSAVGTESIQITMSLVFTGNDYPTNDALITRFIGEEMNKTEFDANEKDEYERLKEMTQQGYSSLLLDILQHREAFVADFRKVFKAVGKEITPKLTFLNVADRMIQNAAVLGATYKLTCKELNYPFSYQEWMDNLVTVYERQSNKRSTGSVVAHWWECFIAAIKDRHQPIREHREFSLSGDELVIHFASVYAKYLEKHYAIFREKGLNKSVLLDKLRKSDAFDKDKSSHRFGEKRSNGICFELSKTGVADQLLQALQYVHSEENIEASKYGRSEPHKMNGHTPNADSRIEPQRDLIGLQDELDDELPY